MARGRRAGPALAALCVALAGCHRDAPTAARTADAAPDAPPSPTASAASAPARPPAGPACHAIGVRGEVRFAGATDAGAGAIGEGQPLPDGAWVSLGPAARATVHVVASGREVGVVGPAFVRACAHGEESLEVAYGTLSAPLGLGARPGAEVFLATPQGFLRYGEAALRIEVPRGSAKGNIALTAGAAAAVLPAGSRVESWGDAGARKPLPGGGFPLRAGDEVVLARDAATAADAWARSVVDACRKASDAAAEVARSFANGEPGSIGERTAHLVETRGRARSACAVAVAAVAAASPDSPLANDLATADARWRALPAHPSPPVP